MPYQTDFTLEELAARRKRLAETMTNDAIALLPGNDAPTGSQVFRQYNSFYYLCGVEVPHAYLLIDKQGRSTLFLGENAHTPFVASNAAWVKQTTGLDQVRPLSFLPRMLHFHRTVYLPSREGEGKQACWDGLMLWRQGVMNDPLDGRLGRTAQVATTIREQFPQTELRDLTPVLDEMRMIKSESELKLMRRAGELTALGALAAMKATKPGMREYQLHAEMTRVYIDGGAVGDAYAPIIPIQANAGDPHYLANAAVMEDGDIVLIDCAPDYRYYTSDIGRMWPINGKFDDAQRSLYDFVLTYHKAVLAEIRPGREVNDIHDDVAAKMRPVFDGWSFATDALRETAGILLDYRGHISHGVGMAVHDVSLHDKRPLEPGMVFAVDPMAWDDKNQNYYRVEDTVVVTEDGYENLTAACPLEIDEIEAVMAG